MPARTTACVIPVFNGERHLAAAVQSALDQRRPFDEIVVVDDGSTDGTRDVMNAFADRITCIHQPNGGVSAARNRAIGATTAELIAPLDADDLLLPDKSEKQLAAFEQDAALELCMAYIEGFRSEEMTDAQWQAELRRRPGHWDKPLPNALVTWMFTRGLFDRIGPFQGKHGEDTDWLLRARSAEAKTRLLPDVLARRRIHPASMTASWTNDAYDLMPDMFKRHLERMRAKKNSKNKNDSQKAQPQPKSMDQ